MVKHCLIIGYGSIGKRHARILKHLGHKVGIVTQREAEEFDCFPDISSAFDRFAVDYAVVCNRTAEHFHAIKKLTDLNFSGTVLVEKPLFETVRHLAPLPFTLFVAYNLRFHPIIDKIREIVKETPIYSMHVYCGQHLSLWREGRDYADSYSASRVMGGGVLRDLSHELDYINWISGGWKQVTALGGKVSNLRIESDDLFSLLIETRLCPAVTLQVNYFDRSPKREILINCKDVSMKADLLNGNLIVGDETHAYRIDRDSTYLLEHEAVITGNTNKVSSLEEGMDVLQLIQAAEEASDKKIWVMNTKL